MEKLELELKLALQRLKRATDEYYVTLDKVAELRKEISEARLLNMHATDIGAIRASNGTEVRK